MTVSILFSIVTKLGKRKKRQLLGVQTLFFILVNENRSKGWNKGKEGDWDVENINGSYYNYPHENGSIFEESHPTL